MIAPTTALPGRFLAVENLGPYFTTAIRQIEAMKADTMHSAPRDGDQVVDAAGDRELMELCGAFIRCERRIHSHNWNGSDPIEDDDARELAVVPIEASMKSMVALMSEQPPTTEAGIRALALALVAWSPNLITQPDETMEEIMLFALLSALVLPAKGTVLQ
jgi:hypothetical protein